MDNSGGVELPETSMLLQNSVCSYVFAQWTLAVQYYLVSTDKLVASCSCQLDLFSLYRVQSAWSFL